MALLDRIQNDIVNILTYGHDVEVIRPLQKAIARRLGNRQDEEQETSPESRQGPFAPEPEPSSTEEAADSAVPPEEAVSTEAISDVAAEPLEVQTNETDGGEGELQQGTLSGPVEAQIGEATPALDDSLMEVFRTENDLDEERYLPAGLVEIGIYDLLEECKAVLQRLKGGLAVG